MGLTRRCRYRAGGPAEVRWYHRPPRRASTATGAGRAEERTIDDGPVGGRAAGTGQSPGGPTGRPVGTLRGAGVQVDTARAAPVAVALVLVALVAVGSVLLVAGYRKNAQIDQLRSQGVPVEVTISHCLGLIGGAG